MLKRVAVFILLLSLIVGVFPVNMPSAEETDGQLLAVLPTNETYETIFPDDTLAKTVALAATGSEDTGQIVTQTDLNKVTSLNITETTDLVTNLEGVQYLTSMTNLKAPNQDITDLSPIEQLIALTNVNFNGNANLEDISALYPLERLRYILLSDTSVKDLTPLYNYSRRSLVEIDLDNLDLYNEDIDTVLNQIHARESDDMLHLHLNGNHIIDFSSIHQFGRGVQTATGQTYSLPSVKVGQELTLNNQIIFYADYLYPPSAISNNGEYVEPTYSWNGSDLADYPEQVSYSWNVDQGNTQFSGTVTQPLTYIRIQADEAISYPKKTVKTEEEFLNEVHASTTDGSVITSDFADVVDFATPGVYEVTLNSVDANGLVAFPVKVQVTVEAKMGLPVITADNEISYPKDTVKTEADFLQEVHAKASDGSTVTSNFDSVVDLNVPGDYRVELNAANEDNAATPVYVVVHVFSDQQEEGTVTVHYFDENGKSLAKDVRLVGEVGSAYETKAEKITGYTLKETPTNANGEFTSDAQTVNYIYALNKKDDGDKTPDNPSNPNNPNIPTNPSAPDKKDIATIVNGGNNSINEVAKEKSIVLPKTGDSNHSAPLLILGSLLLGIGILIKPKK
ncbi:LapB repeat-containing protein [Listeria seeligeri]|uniref:LapB repeat-containing protein n=1 Tax=Listeria seeligeri TaxID=1640 RepID=UPI0015E7C42A|nr:LapB repeat-containing protein [Listeria seeligeri]MBC1594760.1 LapB repeat-containing protein [Listeria seeligeri]MBC1915215.1 LapB repeat-containing protein [Listeria seeligeri]MBC1990703.1 LapB repeat-containing protein [Listeria seeligeri]MBC2197052.1 LapB repeat-containing protein [Listeria seeligeri]MBC2211305.1 LapB repeat-containing protein [Listeria seeligeri]